MNRQFTAVSEADSEATAGQPAGRLTFSSDMLGSMLHWVCQLVDAPIGFVLERNGTTLSCLAHCGTEPPSAAVCDAIGTLCADLSTLQTWKSWPLSAATLPASWGDGALLSASVGLDTGAPLGVVAFIRPVGGDWGKLGSDALHHAINALGACLMARHLQMQLTLQKAALEAAELRERRVYESTPAMLFSTDSRGKLLNASDMLLEKLGYARSDVVGLAAVDLMSTESKARTLGQLIPLLQTNDCEKEMPLQMVTQHGDLIDVLVSAAVERAPDGRISRTLHYVEDVTQRRLVEQNLAEERAHLRNIVNGTSAGTWELDLISGQDLINETYAQMLGYSVAEITAKIRGNFLNIVHSNDRENVSIQWNAHLTGMTTEYEAEFRVQHREGHWTWILSRGKVGARGPDGRPMHISGIHLDVSARRNAIEMANRAAHDLRNTLDALPSRVVYWDTDLRFRFGNRAFRERFSAPGVDLTGRHMSDILGIALYDINVAALERLGEAGDYQEEHEALLPNGQPEHYIIRYLADRVAGKIQGFYVFVFDITQLKQTQEQLQTLNMQLADRSAQAEAASVAKSAFLASMSHEIRTPMNAILGMHKLIQKTPLTPRQLDYLKKSERAAKSLLGLLDDILDYSKVEAGKLSLDPQAFRTDELLDELSVIFSAYVGNKPVEVLFDVGAGLPEVVVGDALRIKQVLINLGGNAIKFTEHGSVVIRVVWDGAHDGFSRTRFVVQDSGIGIAPENQAHIFDGFSQAEASTTRKFGGTGLGLAISQRLVRLMGGNIALESALGMGSVFSFELLLPVVHDIPESLRKPLALAPAVRRVMIIDDHPLSGELLRIAARSLGWEIELLSSGAAGVQRHAQTLITPELAFDLILVDWQMPEMDGWETARQLRAVPLPSGKRPMLFMVSTNSMELMAHRTGEEQALLDGFLSKPVTPAMLSAAVASAMHPALTSTVLPLPASLRRLAGMRVLVVEDNLINQQVAEELLISEGARVSLAANGALGVNAIETADPPYDAVLMDIQMPVMDGYAATRHIRQILKLSQLPVIGLTANAMVTDRDDSLASGMNEHVGKPFDMDHLVSVLLRLTGFKPSPSDMLPSVSPRLPVIDKHDVPSSATADIDLSVALKRMSGNQSMYVRAAQQIRQSLDRLVPDLLELLDASQMADAARLLHTYKGTAGTVGLNRLAAALRELELICKAPAVADAAMQVQLQIQALLPVVSAACQALDGAIAQLQGVEIAPSSRPTGNNNQLETAAVLHELLRLARMSDLSALAYFAESRPALFGMGDAFLADLEDALQSLDLTRVVDICSLATAANA